MVVLQSFLNLTSTLITLMIIIILTLQVSKWNTPHGVLLLDLVTLSRFILV